MNRLRVAFAVLAVLLLAVPAMAGTQGDARDFPKAGLYELHSHPTFMIRVGESKEVVKCDATLTLRTSDPYPTAAGTRRVDLTVVDWKADGTSKLLGGPVRFRMTQGAKVQDPSFVETFHAAGKEHDFPAQAQFVVPYKIETPFGTVSGLYGVTRGTIHSFPPKGDVFSMAKGDVANLVAALMPAPLSAMSAAGEVTPQEVEIQPLACEDQGGGSLSGSSGGN
jgi:hypothetical protein